VKSRRVVLPVELRVDHVCASAAIPVVFPPVVLDCGAGELFFGDGALRQVAPFSPAIRLGASRVLAIGIRSQRSTDAISPAEALAGERILQAGSGIPAPPPLAQICGILLNAVFLDHLDTDHDHLKRMNELILAYGGDRPAASPRGSAVIAEPMRVVTPLVISPSEDLADVAKTHAHKLPRLIRHLLDGLGTPEAQSADLISYLLFDGAYTQALIDIGYRDAHERRDEIEAPKPDLAVLGDVRSPPRCGGDQAFIPQGGDNLPGGRFRDPVFLMKGHERRHGRSRRQFPGQYLLAKYVPDLRPRRHRSFAADHAADVTQR
jgi:NTE family protein